MSADRICFGRKELRGSRLRCLILTSGSRAQVAQRLTSLAFPFAKVDPDQHNWMPGGFLYPMEAQLDKATNLLCEDHRKRISSWWLNEQGGMTPNWDIASTCSVAERPGILLIEAKAHASELVNEEGEKKLKLGCSQESRDNHDRIGSCIKTTSSDLRKATGIDWQLTRDSHYQMSNRFAWACKLTELGFSVVLIYLGFLNADEMTDCGAPFSVSEDWTRCVHAHSHTMFPANVWNTQFAINRVPLAPLIRAVSLSLVPTT